MRRLIWGSLIVGGLVALGAALGTHPVVPHAEGQVERVVPTGDLIAIGTAPVEGQQQIVVIDPGVRVMSVYQIDATTGAIALKSVRNIRADLMMDELNTDSPLPREIRAMLTNR